MSTSRTFDPNMSDSMTPVGSVQIPTPIPVKEPDKIKTGAERFVTVAEVQELINSLTNSIKTGFVLKPDLDRAMASVQLANFELRNRIPTDKSISDIAKESIPACLRDLDSSDSGRQGNVLMLLPGGLDGQDTTYFGTVKTASVAGDDADWVFKFKSSAGMVATFNGGPVVRGTIRVGTIASFSQTITATGDIVYMVYTFSAGTLGIGVASAANFPVSASGTYIKALQSFTVIPASGVIPASIVPLLTYHRGVIQIDGCYS